MFAIAAIVALDLLAQLAAPVPPPTGDARWTTFKTIDGITIERATSDRTAPPWGLAEAEIAAPIDRVAAHLLDFASLGKWMPRVADLRVIERRNADAIVYFKLDLPWPISDRDWTLHYRWQRDGDRFVMIWTDANDRGPARGRAVRVSPMRGYWELTATDHGTTRAHYVSLASLGGYLPRSVAEETAWKEPLGTMRGVRLATTGR